jgi:hypothetical protein
MALDGAAWQAPAAEASPVAGVHCLKVRGIALDPDLEARRQPCAGFCHALALFRRHDKRAALYERQRFAFERVCLG